MSFSIVLIPGRIYLASPASSGSYGPNPCRKTTAADLGPGSRQALKQARPATPAVTALRVSAMTGGVSDTGGAGS